ncbi:GSK-3-binding protein-like [Hyalella azteca]|uniref:GSK-3-binding protein n=1 Tax=Hyalella azteca TaxID=294128 RepID=A0A6A0GXV1_HYAAZ|nr:GSK-3-binding protein [Hyalella azteca]KAA0192389.1 GSK-3-binding protein-like [Hyalella azteca]
MPSKDALCFFPNQSSASSQQDLDDLVSQIKEKLRVKAKAPSHSSCTEKIRLRASPYSIPSRGSKCGCCDSRRCLHRYPNHASNDNGDEVTNSGRLTSVLHNSSNSRTVTDDPYEALQELLREGDLIKEAVRRLNDHYFRPKEKPNSVFYDSDEERIPYPFNLEV